MDCRIRSVPLSVLVLSVFFACARALPRAFVNVTPDGVAIKGYDPLS